MCINTLVYLEWHLKNLENDFSLNSMATVVALSSRNTYHIYCQYTVYWESFAKENVHGFCESRCIRDHFLGII